MTEDELEEVVWMRVIQGRRFDQIAASLGCRRSEVVKAWRAILQVHEERWNEEYKGTQIEEQAPPPAPHPNTKRRRKRKRPTDDKPLVPRGLHIHGVPPQLSPRGPGLALGLPRLSRAGVPRAWRYQVILRCHETCQYCGRTGDPVYGPDCWPWHIDHIVPVARGGETTLDNLTLACRQCNMSKGTKHQRPGRGSPRLSFSVLPDVLRYDL